MRGEGRGGRGRTHVLLALVMRLLTTNPSLDGRSTVPTRNRDVSSTLVFVLVIFRGGGCVFVATAATQRARRCGAARNEYSLSCLVERCRLRRALPVKGAVHLLMENGLWRVPDRIIATLSGVEKLMYGTR